MLKQNLNEIVTTDEIPSMDFMVKKEFSDYRNIRKTILLKEIEFKKCHNWINDFSLESVQLEKELGELYTQLMKATEMLHITCVKIPFENKNNSKTVKISKTVKL